MATPSLQVRPQPAGIYPPPVSFLLLPDTDDQQALEALMTGDTRVLTRGNWRFYKLALDGRLDEAHQAITGASFVDEWNRFVLRPDAARFWSLRERVPEELIALLDCAAFAAGLSEISPSADGLDGELRAVVLLTAASIEIESEQFAAAVGLLEEALEARARSLAIAGGANPQSDRLARALIVAHQGDPDVTKDAIQLAGDTPLASLRAELWAQPGNMPAWQEAANGRREPLLSEAAKAYQEAIRCGLSVDRLPELYAMAQSNLALTYLTIPARDASDQLRMGIAVQCLREALKVFRRDTHPELWSSAQLNLANALQYLPTSHPEENLQQAVNLYEELLEKCGTRRSIHSDMRGSSRTRRTRSRTWGSSSPRSRN